MSRYIDADALIAEMERCSYETWSKGVNPTWWAQAVKVKDNIVKCIERQPTADVVEVSHGTWYHGTENGAVYAKCSACGRKMNYSCYGYAYCALCGAKMDGKRREKNEG